MEVKLLKLTPMKENKLRGHAFADFELKLTCVYEGTAKIITLKIKGCKVKKAREMHMVFLPKDRVTTRKDQPIYSCLIFDSETMAKIIPMMSGAVQETWPFEQWKNGVYSIFNQGIAVGSGDRDSEKALQRV